MNTLRKIRALCLVTLLGIPFHSAMAGEFYLGAGAGATDFRNINCSAGLTCDTSDTGWKLFGGYQFTPIFGVEGAWVDAGESTTRGTIPGTGVTNGKFKVDGFVFAGTAGWPISDRFRLYGKLGAYFYDAKFNSTLNGVASQNTSKSGTELMYGLGLQYDFNERVGARLEWERYNDINSNAINQGPFDVDFYSASLVILFPR